MTTSIQHSVIRSSDGIRFALVVCGLPEFTREDVRLDCDGEDGLLVTDCGEWLLPGLMLVDKGQFAATVSERGAALLLDMRTKNQLRRSVLVPVSDQFRAVPAQALAA